MVELACGLSGLTAVVESVGNKICFLLIYLSGDLGTREVNVKFPGFVHV